MQKFTALLIFLHVLVKLQQRIQMRRHSGRCSWERFLDNKHRIIIDPKDTISRLPETVLNHIVSFLPNLENHHVGFLSRKWRRLEAQNQYALSLTGCRLNDQLELSKILNDDFHSVEFLTLRKCSGTKELKLVNYKLRNVSFYFCGSLKHLELKTPFLKSFRFYGTSILRPCRIDFGICKQMKVVRLKGVAINHMDCNITFPVLQTLSLNGCDMSGSISISSINLKKLSLSRLRNPITIDAPNLYIFEYCGSMIIPFENMNFPHLSDAKIQLNPCRYQKRDEEWFSRLINMLICLKHTKKLEFHTNSDKNIMVPKVLRKTLVPPFDGRLSVKVQTSSRSSNIVDLTDAMLWISPRVSDLRIENPKSEFILELEHQELLSGTHANSCSFCTSHTLRCWRHSVIEYALEHTWDELEMKMDSYIKKNLKKVGRVAIE